MRERPSFYAEFSICLKPRAAPATRSWWAPKVNRPLRTLELNSTQLPAFSQIPKILSASGHDVIHLPRFYFLSGIPILTSLNDTSSPGTRAHLRSCLHLTNPCTKRKILTLTKPKCKIYKTKSLGHYITSFLISVLVSG